MPDITPLLRAEKNIEISFGIMTRHDELTLLKTLELVDRDFRSINIVELGTADGRTARGIEKFFRWNPNVCLTGVDLRPPKNYPGFTIAKDTQAALSKVRDITFLFIDANHSLEYTLNDFKGYSELVVPGGYIALHDTSPLIKPFSSWQGTGPKDDATNYIDCRHACKQLGLLDGSNSCFELIFDEWDPEFVSYGGMVVVKKKP